MPKGRVSEKKRAEVYAIVEEYLADPNNDNMTWTHISREVLKKHEHYLRTTLTADDRKELWAQALKIRRDFYAPHLSAIDKALLEKAIAGDVPAIKLAYQRFENWAPSEKKIHEGGDKPIGVEHGVTDSMQEKLNEIYQQD